MLLPIIVAVGFMAGTLHNGVSVTSVSAILVFFMLAFSMLRGAWQMAKEWDKSES
ncbi:MAG: hypothetical protein ABI591_09300 [Kofleriaceae bacterium]